MKVEKSLRTKFYRYQTQSISSGCPQPAYAIVPVTVGKIRVLEANPLYKSQIASGASATTPYSSSVRTSTWKGGLIEGYGVNPAVMMCRARNTYSGLDPFKPPEVSNISTTNDAISAAAIGLLSKINKRQQAVDGLTIAAEFRKTVGMIRSPARLLRLKAGVFTDNLRDLRGRIKRPKDWRDTVASSWLEFTYGIKPLMNDIADVANALIEFRDNGVTPIRYMHDLERHVSTSPGSNGIIGSAIMRWDVEKIDETTVKWVAGLRETLNYNKPSHQRLFELSGLDLNNVLPAAWELVPYSFLIDYFVNVGSVLSAACTSTRDVVWTSRTVVNTSSWEWINFRLTNTSPGWAVYVVKTYPYQFATSRFISRSAAMPSVSMSSLQIRVPGWSSKWINMGALVAQTSLFRK